MLIKYWDHRYSMGHMALFIYDNILIIGRYKLAQGVLGMQKNDFFISYSGPVDHSYAIDIQKRLNCLMLKSVISEDEYNNQDITERIKKELESSEYQIIIISPDSLKTAWVHQELGYFLGLKDEQKQFLLIRGSKKHVPFNDPKKFGFLKDFHALRFVRKKRAKRSRRGIIDQSLEYCLNTMVKSMIEKQIIKSKDRKIELCHDLPCHNDGVNHEMAYVQTGTEVYLPNKFRCHICGHDHLIDSLTWELLPTILISDEDKLENIEREARTGG
nr:hypothetical protein BSM_15390 [uncultured archaeon]CBH38447.1 hypothetical protein BSM_19240 [uncultured archaeon]